MADSKWKEVTVYVHGISPERNVESHSVTYDTLQENVDKELEKLGKEPLGEAIKVEWGWEYVKNKEADRYLAEAERRIYDMTFKAYKKAKDLTINPNRWIVKNKLRPLFLFGIADMFYYVSEYGKKSIRGNVFDTVLGSFIKLGGAKKGKSPEEGLSITCIGHSAGTVILHDLLYNIFTKNYTARKTPPAYKYIYEDYLRTARDWAKKGKLRLRKIYTMGSPITPLTFRSNTIIEKLMAVPSGEGFFDAEDIGISATLELTNPRWVNFWDPDDVIAYPLEFIYKKSKGIIEDKCVDVSDLALLAHGVYWTDKKVAKYIAETY